jgi:hypothetical protein
MIEIHDRGIGLTTEDFADINHKLANPPTVDVEVAKRMGLFVVGRLADRHGIRVQLRPSGEQAGTTSLVMLPEPITHGGTDEDPPAAAPQEQDFTVSRIVPEHDEAAAAEGRRTAAELGFDDSRYEALDPVGRSLVREGRRAQLEAAATAPQEQPGLPHQRQEPPGPGQPAQAPQQPSGQSSEQSYEQLYEQPYEGGFAAPAGGQPYPQPYQQDGYQDGYDRIYGQGHDPAYPQQQAYEQGFGTAPYSQDGPAYEPQPAGYQQNGFAAQEYETGFTEQPEQGGYAPQFPGHAPADDGRPVAEPEVTESATPLPQAPQESVVSPSLTDAGLPRRERRQHGSPQEQPEQPAQETAGPQDETQPDEAGWRSTNDENWQRAEQVREPKAGGVTPSGLPRRVPRANLVPGAATQTPQGGPQVSRAPEDVRGRLSNLRRGVQQGRTAGTDTNAHATDSRFGGPHNQER